MWGQANLSPGMKLLLAEVSSSEGMSRSATHDGASEQMVPVFIHFDDTAALEQMEDAGAVVGTVAGHMATARIPAAKIREVAGLPHITYIENSSPVRFKMDEAKADACVDRIHAGDGLAQPYRGKGVVVGIVDQGVEYRHPNFYDEDKTHLRIKRVWNQNKDGEHPIGYAYGAELQTEEAILDEAFDMTTGTHGTHVLGIAAGADRLNGNNYFGVADEAELVVVSLNTAEMEYGDNTAVIDGINYIYDFAESEGKPCVVNLSLGSHMGPHDGTSTFDRMADALQGPGRLLVGAAGNEGAAKFHLSKTFHATDGDDCDKVGTFVSFRYLFSEYSMIEMWGDEGMDYQFIPFVYNIAEDRIEKVYDATDVNADFAETAEYRFNEDTDRISGTIRLSGEINPNNGKTHGMAVFNFYRSDNYRIGFYVASKDEGTVHMWTDYFYSEFSDFGCEGFQDGDNSCTVGEIGGTGKRIVSVGAYVTRDFYTRFGIYYPSGEDMGCMVSTASHGPAADGRLKPEISAPGSFIISSVSSVYTGEVAKAANVTWNGQKYSYGYMQGSSMASPVVAGVLATWLQANPELTPEDVKDVLARTAMQDGHTGSIPSEGSNLWGYGKIDAWNGLKECIHQAGIDNVTQDYDEELAMAFDGRCLRILVSGNVVAKVYSASGTEVLCRAADGADGEAVVDLSPLCSGIYVINIMTDKKSVSKKIAVCK